MGADDEWSPSIHREATPEKKVVLIVAPCLGSASVLLTGGVGGVTGGGGGKGTRIPQSAQSVP